VLRAADVWFSYALRSTGPGAPAEPILQGVTLAAPRGGLVGVLGPNGSGKTTLLRLLAGFARPARGRVTLDDAPLDSLSRTAVARRIAVVPQETHLAFDYTVLEIVLMGRYPHLGAFELEGPGDLAVARDALAATGTAHLEQRSFSTLSGGEKQRVVIASALAQSAEILLLDEPTASLDLGYQIEIAELLRRLNRERGITMVLSAHDLNFAASVCQELTLLKGGRVLAAGPIERTLTAELVRELYGVTADVRFHEAAGHLTVVPIGRTPAPARRQHERSPDR
jgi:iron complex transport system ATP-binding protein